MSTSTSQPTGEVLSPTTGEPIAVPARRNKVGLWLLIAGDVSGTIALLIAYAYLWQLNVDNAWAPNTIVYGGNGNVTGRTTLPWAEDWPFWLITVLIGIACLLMWSGYRGIRDGSPQKLISAAAGASIVALVGLGVQIWQLATLPFPASAGSYASAVTLFCLSSLAHLLVGGFVIAGVMNRTRAGRITVADPSQALIAARWVTWLVIASFLCSLFTLVMKDSPNTNPPMFQTFTRTAPTASPAPPPSPAASGSAASSAAPAASASPSAS